MCEMCDNSDQSIDEFLQDVSERITAHRFVVQSVLGSTTSAEFSYSIGLTEHGLPELIMTGLRREDATQIIRVWGDYLLDTSTVLPGERLTTGPWRAEAVLVDRPREHLLVADTFYGPAVRALQLVWADRRGRWPWDPGHSARRAGQPLLGSPAPRFCEEHAPDRLDVPPYL